MNSKKKDPNSYGEAWFDQLFRDAGVPRASENSNFATRDFKSRRSPTICEIPRSKTSEWASS